MTLVQATADLDDALLLIQRARAEIQRAGVVQAPAAPTQPAPAQPPATPSPAATAGLMKPEAFYTHIRKSDLLFGGTLTPAQFEGCEADLDLGAGRLPLSWMAYCLATDYHETSHTMQPIHEMGGRAYLAKYDTGRLAAALGNTPEADGDGILYAGRGKPQVTGARNYKHANKRLHELGILKPDEDLVANPDLMLRMDVATAALVFGMLEGWYTGKALKHYIQNPGTLEQFTNARRIINGTDKAGLIASYAMVFQEALTLGGWL